MRRIEFLGVSTAQSIVNRTFLGWAECLGEELALARTDLPLGSSAADYREYVLRLKAGHPNCVGALITSHKAAVFDAARDLFDNITSAAEALGEVGMVYWRNSRMVGDANDCLSTEMVSRKLLCSSPEWVSSERRALILGGGGAGLALTRTLANDSRIGCREITIAETRGDRASVVAERVSQWSASAPIRVVRTSGRADNLLEALPRGSLVANATGLGKDVAGSPISTDAVFPLNGYVWEFNYRFLPQSEPNFLEIASRQKEARHLTLEDGWDYFIWGWLGVMTNAVGVGAGSQQYEPFRRVAEAAR